MNYVSIVRDTASRKWMVYCNLCDGSWLARPWVAAAPGAWDQALWWGNWHDAEHQRTQCESCERHEHIPVAKVHTDRLITIGDRIFTRTYGTSWQETTP